MNEQMSDVTLKEMSKASLVMLAKNYQQIIEEMKNEIKQYESLKDTHCEDCYFLKHWQGEHK